MQLPPLLRLFMRRVLTASELISGHTAGAHSSLDSKTPTSKPAKLESTYQCASFIKWASEGLELTERNTPVVIIGRYAQAAFGSYEQGISANVPQAYFTKVHEFSTSTFLAEFGRAVTSSACTLAARRPVYMVRPFPEMGVNVPKALSRKLAVGINEDISVSLASYQQRNQWVWNAQDEAMRVCGVKVLNPLPYLCNSDRCFGSSQGRPLYFDGDHLSEYGNRLLTPLFEEIFVDLGARESRAST